MDGLGEGRDSSHRGICIPAGIEVGFPQVCIPILGG